MSSETFSGEIPYSEAARWFVRIKGESMSAPEWASFRNWMNVSRWNRLAFGRVGAVWRGAPDTTEISRPAQRTAGIRFAWHHSDAWRDAVLPLAMTRPPTASAGPGHAVCATRVGDTVSIRTLFDANAPGLPGFETMERFAL